MKLKTYILYIVSLLFMLLTIRPMLMILNEKNSSYHWFNVEFCDGSAKWAFDTINYLSIIYPNDFFGIINTNKPIHYNGAYLSAKRINKNKIKLSVYVPDATWNTKTYPNKNKMLKKLSTDIALAQVIQKILENRIQSDLESSLFNDNKYIFGLQSALFFDRYKKTKMKHAALESQCLSSNSLFALKSAFNKYSFDELISMYFKAIQPDINIKHQDSLIDLKIKNVEKWVKKDNKYQYLMVITSIFLFLSFLILGRSTH